MPLRPRFGAPHDVPSDVAAYAAGIASPGLRALWVPGLAHDGRQLVNLAPDRAAGTEFLPPATSAVPIQTTIMQGPAALFTGASGGGYYRRTSGPWLSGQIPCTLACLFTWGGSQTNYPSFYGITNGATGTRYLSIVPNAGSLAYNVNLGMGDIIIDVATMTAGHSYLAIGTTRAANNHEAVLYNLTSGVLSAATSTSGAGASAPTLTEEVLGGAYYGSDNFLDGRVAAAWGWSRGFTGAELREFVLGPWDMVAPPVRLVRGYTAGGGDTALAGAATGSGTAAAALTTGIALAGAATGAGTAAGALTTAIALSGAASGTGAATGALTTAIGLAGAGTGAGTAAGVLTTAIALAGAPAGTGAAAAALTTSVTLAAAPSGTGTAAGALTTGIALAGAATGSGTASGALAADGASLAGAATGEGTAAGALTTAIALSGAASGSGVAAGSLATAIALSGATGGTGTATGALTTGIALAATASGTGTATGDLTTEIRLAGAAAGAGTVAGDLTTGSAGLSAAVAASGTATGALTTAILLAGGATGWGIASGSLATGVPLPPDPRRTVRLRVPAAWPAISGPRALRVRMGRIPRA